MVLSAHLPCSIIVQNCHREKTRIDEASFAGCLAIGFWAVDLVLARFKCPVGINQPCLAFREVLIMLSLGRSTPR